MDPGESAGEISASSFVDPRDQPVTVFDTGQRVVSLTNNQLGEQHRHLLVLSRFSGQYGGAALVYRVRVRWQTLYRKQCTTIPLSRNYHPSAV